MPVSALPISFALPKMQGCAAALLLGGILLLGGCGVTNAVPAEDPGPEVTEAPPEPIDGVDPTEAVLDPIDDAAVFDRVFQLESLARELSAAIEGGYDATEDLKRKFEDVMREIEWRRAEISAKGLDQARLLRLERLKRVPIVVRLPKPAR